jgi:hypothetical protein
MTSLMLFPSHLRSPHIALTWVSHTFLEKILLNKEKMFAEEVPS